MEGRFGEGFSDCDLFDGEWIMGYSPLHKPRKWRKSMEEKKKNDGEGGGKALCKWRRMRKMMMMMVEKRER